MNEGKGEGRRDEFHGGGEEDERVLGGDRFMQRVLNRAVTTQRKISLRELINVVCRSYEITEQSLRYPGRERLPSEARSLIGWFAQKSGQVTLTEVAHEFGRDVATLSRGVQRVREKVKTSKPMAKRVADIINASMQA